MARASAFHALNDRLTTQMPAPSGDCQAHRGRLWMRTARTTVRAVAIDYRRVTPLSRDTTTATPGIPLRPAL